MKVDAQKHRVVDDPLTICWCRAETRFWVRFFGFEFSFRKLLSKQNVCLSDRICLEALQKLDFRKLCEELLRFEGTFLVFSLA